tara:strand:- start:2461 stop:3543 length:1083 start_codon:yes stop_codon:yes gene_type:complete
MGFKALKNHIGSLAGAVVSDIAGAFQQQTDQKSAGKVSAKLLSKSPFEIPSSSAETAREDPLSFKYVQYPIDLGTEELGHYIIFESGFVKYQPQQGDMFKKSAKTENRAPGEKSQTEKELGNIDRVTSKVPDGSVSNSAIALYMPPNVKVAYNQSYDTDTESGLAGDLQQSFTNVKSAEGVRDKIIGAFEGVSGAVARQGAQAVGEFISLAGAGDPVRFGLKRIGLAINPRNEAFYNTPQQRTFSYTFDFWPRNADEAEIVKKIIHIFKYNSHPGLAKSGGFFVVPNYFKISYMFNSKENPHLHKIGACFCTDVEVDFSPDGQWSTFATGQPVHTKLTVNFVEDRILTKGDIGDDPRSSA